MDSVFQGYNLSPVILEAEGLLRDGVIDIGDNDLLKIHMLDCALKKDNENGKNKLIKLNPNAHIDGMAAVIDALTVRQKWYGEIGEQLKNA
jgi:phage terminase large subunit-like protein